MDKNNLQEELEIENHLDKEPNVEEETTEEQRLEDHVVDELKLEDHLADELELEESTEDLEKLDGVEDNVVQQAINEAKHSDVIDVEVVDLEEESKEEKSLFGKKKKKDKKDETIKDLNEQLLRRRAEFENFRKRSEKEKSQMFETGAKSIIEKLLPVVDNFERGLATIPEEEKNNPIMEGMDLIYKQLMTMLEDAGVKPIEAVGNTFDPNLHNAVMHIEDPELDTNIVVEEFQKGYTYRDSVVRYSMVKSAN